MLIVLLMKNAFKIAIVLIGIIACTKSQTINPTIVEIDDIGISWQIDILYIHFQEGFEKTPATLYMSNQIMFSRIITTKEDGTGFAASTAFKMPSKKAIMRLELGSLRWNVVIEPSNGNFIGISIIDKNLKIKQSRQPYYYD